MGRKKKIAKFTETKQAQCVHCNEIFPQNAPQLGYVFEFAGKTQAICRGCGCKVAQMMRSITLRWG